MTVSTDAILVYGINFGDFDEDPPYPFDERGREEDVLYDELKDTPLNHITHCSGEYPMHIIGFRNTHSWARRGYPVEFDALPVADVDVEPLKAFCEKHNLPFKDPKWILCSEWA